MTSEFAGVDDVTSRLREVGYLADDRVATTVFLAARLQRPLLLEGPAGVGKTDLARSLATALSRPLVRLQCYESQDESRALYEWDYGKQLLYTQILREKIGDLVSDAPDLETAVDLIAEREDVFFSERFLSERPILEAIRSPEPVVLLIDEVDRSDEALEAVLLEALAENQISIPEIGTITAAHPPLVLLTSNNTRDLSSALKRRCLHLFLDYPEAERELEIVRSKDTGLDDALAQQLVEIVRELRALDLRKPPSIAETVDWARTLAVLGTTELNLNALTNTASVVLKYERDLERAIEFLAEREDGVPPGKLSAASSKSGPPPQSPRSASPPRSEPNGNVVDPTDNRQIRDERDRKGRHGAAAFFGGRGSAEAERPSRSTRRPL